MNDFKETLYESVLYSFGKILSQYDVFSQENILSEVGKEIIEYLKCNGFEFTETESIEDISDLIKMFVKKTTIIKNVLQNVLQIKELFYM